MSAGKGDRARNCYSAAFRSGYDGIKWGFPNTKSERATESYLHSLKNSLPKLIPAPRPSEAAQEFLDMITRSPVQCCKYDYNFDGNCHIHSAPGVLRISATRNEQYEDKKSNRRSRER